MYVERNIFLTFLTVFLMIRSQKLLVFNKETKISPIQYENENPMKSLQKQVWWIRTEVFLHIETSYIRLEKTIRRKRSRKSFLPDQRSSESQLASTAAPVVYVSSMSDVQPTLIKSSPKSDADHDNNPLLISDDENDQSKKGNILGGGEDECAVDSGACLRPSGSSIKCKNEFLR